MSKHSQLTLDASKISLCNDAHGGIWGHKHDRVTWDNCIQYSALKPGEFLQFRGGGSRHWTKYAPAPQGRAARRNSQVLEVRLANDKDIFSHPQRWNYGHAYFDLGDSYVSLHNDTGKKNGFTSDHRLKPELFPKHRGIKNVKLQFRGSDGVWGDEQPDPVAGHNRHIVRVVGEGDENEGGYWGRARSYGFFYFDFKSLKVELENDTGKNKTDRVTTYDRLKISGLAQNAVAEYQWPDGNWYLRQPNFELGKNIAKVRQRALRVQDGSLSSVSTFQFTLVKEDQDRSPLNALEVKLVNDTGDDMNDRITTDDQLKIGGQVKDAVAEYQWSDGSWHQKQPVFGLGKNTVEVRQRADDGSVSPSTKFQFTLVQELNALAVKLANDTGDDKNDRVTTDDQLKIGGLVQDAVAEYQWPDGSWHEKQPVFEFGENTAKVRQRDRFGSISDVTEFKFEYTRTHVAKPLPVVLENNGAIDVISLAGESLSAAADRTRWGGKAYATHLKLDNSGGRNFQYQFSEQPGFAWLPYQNKVDLNQYIDTIWVREVNLEGVPVSPPEAFTYEKLADKPPAPSVGLANDSGRSKSDWFTNDLSIAVADWGVSGRLAYRLSVPSAFIKSDSVLHESNWNKGEAPVFWWGYSDQKWDRLADPTKLITPQSMRDKRLSGVGVSVDFFSVSESGVPSEPETLKITYAPGSRYVPHASGEKAYVSGVPMEPTGLGVEVVFVKDDGYSKTDKVSSQIFAYLSGWIPSGERIQHRLNGADWTSVESWELASQTNTFVAKASSSRVGQNTVEVRNVDKAGNESGIYEYHYTYDPAANEQLSSELTLTNTQAYANSFGRSSKSNVKDFARRSRDIVLSTRSKFSNKRADRVTNFNPADGGQLMLDQDWLPVAPHRVKGDLLTVVYRKRGQRKASKAETPLIFNQTNGLLFLNGNGSRSGWGDMSEGGLLARLDTGLFLQEFNLGFL